MRRKIPIQYEREAFKNYMGNIENVKVCVDISFRDVGLAKETESYCGVKSGITWDATHGPIGKV